MPKKDRRIRITSPKGIAKYPRVNTPDTKFDSDGVYRIQLLLDPDDPGVKEFLAQLDELADAAVKAAKVELEKNGKKASAKNVQRMAPYKEEVDADGEPTGKIEVSAKRKAVYRKDDKVITFDVKLFDAKGRPVDPEKVRVYGGSVVRISCTARPYYVAGMKTAGISLDLQAVQIIELAEREDNAKFFGFEEEDGFEVDEAASGDSDGGDEEDEAGEDDEEDDF